MLQIVSWLRVARLLAFLAVLLTAGVGPHAHAHVASIGEPYGVLTYADADGPAGGGEDDGPSLSARCGPCHPVQALPPSGAVLGTSPTVLRATLPAPELPASLPAPDLPARPPRPGTA